jgi:hypothetical protein
VACGVGKLSQSTALELIRKSDYFDKPQEGLVLKILEVSGISYVNETTAEVQFRWVAGSADAPDLSFEIDSPLVFERGKSSWKFDPDELGKTLQSAIELRVDPTAAERYIKIISTAQGDFSSRRGRYASLEEMIQANIIPTGLVRTDSGFQIAGYFFKMTATPDRFTVTGRSLAITESIPAYYSDSTGGIRISKKGPANAQSQLIK